MKHALRTALVACLIHTVLIGFFIWQAFFARTPNDAGMLVVASAFPTSWLAEWLWQFREPLAAALHLPVNDRFAMSFDATLGWLLGCLQYGILAVIWSRLMRAWRQPHVRGA